MNAVFTPKRIRISVDRYQKMVAAGVLTRRDRIELIEGEMIDMAPIGARHAAITARLNGMLVLAAGNEAIVFPGGPVNLGEFSEPQPDLLLVRARADFYANGIPEPPDVLLVVEVSDTTLAFDRSTKRELYARHGIPEYWIVDVEDQRVLVHREPGAHGFARESEITANDTISPLALPGTQIVVRELFA